MIKLSRTGITTLKRQYKSVLLKCLLINAGILLAAGSANAEVTVVTNITTQDFNNVAVANNDGSYDITGKVTIKGIQNTATAIQTTSLYTKDEIDNALNGKLSTLTAGNGINITGSTISAVAKTDGGLISGSDGLYIANGGVGTAQLANSAVDDTKLATNAVTSDKINAGAVTEAKIAAGAVTTAKIASGAVTDAQIAANAVTNAKLADGAVTDAKIGAGAVTTAKIASGAVTDAQIAANAVTTAKIASGAVTDAQIAANAVTTAKIASGAVTDAQIAANAVTTAKIASGAVTDAQLATSAVTNAKLADGAVTDAKIGAGAVTTAKIAAGAVTDAQLAANAVTTDKINDGAVKLAKLNSDVSTTTATTGSSQLITSGGVYTLTHVADGNYISEGTNVAGNLTALDTAIGNMSAFGGQNYAKSTTSVAANLTSLDTALKGTNDILGGAETITPSSTSLLTNQIGTGTNTVVASLRTVADNAAGLHLNNTFDGTNTFTKNTTFEKGVTIGTAGVLSEQTDVSFTGLGSDTPETGQKILKVTGSDALVAETSVATTKGFSVIKKTADGEYTELATFNTDGIKIGDKFTVAAATGNIETAGTLNVDGAATFGAAGDPRVVIDAGIVKADKGINVNDKFTVDDNGAIVAANGAFTVANDGKTIVGNDFAVTDKFTVAGATGNTAVGGTLSVASNATIYGNTTVGGTLEVAQATLLHDNLTVEGNAAVNGKLNVGDDLAVSDKFTVAAATGNTAVGGTLSVASDAAIYGNTQLGGNLNVTDKFAVAGATGDTTIGGKLAVAGDSTINGKLTVGNDFAVSDKFTVAAATGDTIVGGNFNVTDKFVVAGATGNTTIGGTLETAGATLLHDTLTVQKLTTLNSDTGLTFDGDTTKVVKAIDDGSVKQDSTSATKSTDMATVATVLKSAENADYTGTTLNASGNTPATIKDGLNLIGNLNSFAGSRHIAGAENLAEATLALDKGLTRLEDKVRDFKKEFKSGMAQMAAMSALVPNARAHGDTQISVGTGTYEGQTAAAFGGFHWINDNLMLNIGASYGDSNNMAYRAGLTWSW